MPVAIKEKGSTLIRERLRFDAMSIMDQLRLNAAIANVTHVGREGFLLIGFVNDPHFGQCKVCPLALRYKGK